MSAAALARVAPSQTRSSLNVRTATTARIMPQEIERKYLVCSDRWRSQITRQSTIRQGYLCIEPARTVRVRLRDRTGFLTVKGQSTGIARAEYEYEIPPDEASELLDRLCLRPLIEKTRACVEFSGLTWEIDEFSGENAGLILAEVELESAAQAVVLPDWVGAEVSSDRRYFNAYLSQHPFSTWPENEPASPD